MSWIAFFLGLVLAAAGAAGLYASLDLLTTQLGLVYATCGAVGVSGGVVVIAIGLLIRRVDAVRRTILRANEQVRSERLEPVAPSLPTGLEPTVLVDAGAGSARDAPAAAVAEPTVAAPPVFDEAGQREIAAINENRKGHSPPLEAIDPEPAGPPTLIGRYSAGGANYSIFSDGSIEAETDEGAFKFGSMTEFKAYIAGKRN